MDDVFAELSNKAASINVTISPEHIDSLKKFCLELQKYNEHTNLVGNASNEILINNHILDALTLIPVIQKHINSLPAGNLPHLIDIGSGAGFPALVIAIMIDDLHVTLTDSVGKKTNFLNLASEICSLSNKTEIINVRAESLAQDKNKREMFDIATARAVGKIKLICELAIPFLKIGGLFLIQKSKAQLDEEIQDANELITLLGGKIKETIPLNKEFATKDHQIMIIEKEKPTPRQYPRTIAKIKQEAVQSKQK